MGGNANTTSVTVVKSHICLAKLYNLHYIIVIFRFHAIITTNKFQISANLDSPSCNFSTGMWLPRARLTFLQPSSTFGFYQIIFGSEFTIIMEWSALELSFENFGSVPNFGSVVVDLALLCLAYIELNVRKCP